MELWPSRSKAIYYFFGFFFRQPHVAHMMITSLLIKSIPYKSRNGKGPGLSVILYLHALHYVVAGFVITIIYRNVIAHAYIR